MRSVPCWFKMSFGKVLFLLNWKLKVSATLVVILYRHASPYYLSRYYKIEKRMKICEGKTKCEVLVMCRFRWVSILQNVFCKTSALSLCQNQVSKSFGGGKSSFFPWNIYHECLVYSNLYLVGKIVSSIALNLVFLVKCPATAHTFLLVFLYFSVILVNPVHSYKMRKT